MEITRLLIVIVNGTLYRMQPLPSDRSPFLVWDIPTRELLDTFEKLAVDLESNGQDKDSKQVKEWLESQRDR